MSSYNPDLQEFLYEGTALPVPDWERAAEWMKIHVPLDDQFDVWTELAGQWLELTNGSFSDEYETLKTKHFLLFGFAPETPLASLGRFAEECRREITSRLPGLARFDDPGKTPILIFAGQEAYYSHVDDYHADGEYGGSAGMHIRTRYAHVALAQLRQIDIFATLAHELTHASLDHLQMPQWLEEGLAQLFEHDLAGKHFALDPKEVAEQKQFWRSEGLDAFWSGDGFSSAGNVQKHSYQLAEILMRLLLMDYAPRWFGFDRRPVVQLMNFLRDAQRDDAGEASAQEHLNLSLDDIAAKSLGRRS